MSLTKLTKAHIDFSLLIVGGIRFDEYSGSVAFKMSVKGIFLANPITICKCYAINHANISP